MNRPGAAAFTFVELLVVLAVLALGAMLLAPALARTKPDPRSATCLNNHRQLARAWLMYAGDNNDQLAISVFEYPTPTQPSWAAGRVDWATTEGNTNTIYLTDTRYSIMASYFCNDARLFKCPADQYISPFQRSFGWKERVRSVSQNVYAASNIGAIDSPPYAQVTKLTGLLNPSPAGTWVSMDEHPDSINDSRFFAPNAASWIDLPANYHDGGAGVALADGHVETHRWQGSLLKFSINYSFPPLPPAPNDPDILWLRFRTPRLPGAN